MWLKKKGVSLYRFQNLVCITIIWMLRKIVNAEATEL